MRLGKGSIGGKARGLGVRQLDHRAQRAAAIASRGCRCASRARWSIPTDEFDKFMESNQILEGGLANTDAKTVLERCLAGQLSDDAALRDLPQAIARG